MGHGARASHRFAPRATSRARIASRRIRHVHGGCLCGAVRYEIDGRISPIVLCHCSKCRKANGSAFHAGSLCRKTRFRFVGAIDTIGRYQTESGYETTFCTRCGSPVPRDQRDGEFVVLPSGGDGITA